MKKKILLAILVVMVFTCLFAVSVSADNLVAADNNDYGTVSTIDSLESSKPTSYTDYTSRAVLVGADGKYYTVPSYYVLADNATFTWNLVDEIKTLTGASSASNLKNYVVRMEIPEGITSMSTGRFESSTSLVAVKMPTTLTGELGSYTFKNCTNLTTVENLENTTITSLSVSNTTNRGGVFPGCTSLTSVSLPSTITAIGKWSFTACSNLKVVNIPVDAKITFIGEWAFEQAKSLENFYFSSTLETLEAGVFAGCTGLKTAENFGNTKVTALKSNASTYNNGSGVFSSCSALTSLELPSTLETIDGWAAASCSSLATFTIPRDAKITYIGKYAFEKAIFTEVYLPSTLETLEAGAFSNCKSLATVENLGNTQITEIGEYTFQNCPLNKIELPSTLSGTIGQYAFAGHRANQDKLVIPNGVTAIAKCAFAGSNNNSYVIKELVLSANLESFSEYALEKNRFSVVYMPATLTSLPKGLFSNWSSNFVIVYTGTSDQLDALVKNTNTDANGNFTTDAVKNIKSAEEYGDIVVDNVTGKSIVYGYNPCKAFYNDVHNLVAEEGNTCSGTCDRVGCGLFKIKEDAVHAEKLKLAFGESKSDVVDYYADMYVLNVCPFCQTEASAEAYGAIFENKGMSAALDGTVAITFSIAINYDALAVYEEMAQTTLAYGLVVSAAPSASPITGVVDGELTLAGNSVSVNMTDAGYTYIAIKITNVPATQTLNCAGYVVENGNVTYLNYETATAEAEILSYEVILEKTATDEEQA